VLLGDGGQRAGSVVHVVEGNGIVADYLGCEEIRELLLGSQGHLPQQRRPPMPAMVIATCSQVGTRRHGGRVAGSPGLKPP
jgi:hypothetical protein